MSQWALVALACSFTACQAWSADCVSPPSGLVAWWPGEGNANDVVGTNDGTPINGVPFAPGKVGQAFSLDGVSQFIEVVHSPSLCNSNYSVETWVNPLSQVNNPLNQDIIFGQGYGQCLLLAHPGTSGVQTAFGFGTGLFTFFWAVSTNDIPIGQFSHLAGRMEPFCGCT